jgi:ribA/ribD-fused uncharacterized protein
MMTMMEKITKCFENEESRRIKAEEELAAIRSQLSDYSKLLANQTSSKQEATPTEPLQATPSVPPLPNLLLGTSLLRNVDPAKLENFHVTSKGGATIDDLHKELNDMSEDTAYNEMILVAGSIDLENKNVTDIVSDCQALIVSAGMKCQSITISSILPRTDKDLKTKTKEANDALKEMCANEGHKFVDNDPSFHLLNGNVNEAYLTHDGLHLTKRGLDSLLQNCNVIQSGSVFTPVRYPGPEKKNTVLFKGHKDPLSNFYPVEIHVNGRVFQSTEAAYQHSKAETMGDHDSASRIMHADNALQAMRIASRIKTDERWKRQKVEVMKSLIKEKIRVCEAARTALLNSGSKKIVEDTAHEL